MAISWLWLVKCFPGLLEKIGEYYVAKKELVQEKNKVETLTAMLSELYEKNKSLGEALEIAQKEKVDVDIAVENVIESVLTFVVERYHLVPKLPDTSLGNELRRSALFGDSLLDTKPDDKTPQSPQTS